MIPPDDKAVDKVHEAMVFKYGEQVADAAAEIAEEFAHAISMKAEYRQVGRTELLHCSTETIWAIIRMTKEMARKRDEEQKRN